MAQTEQERGEEPTRRERAERRRRREEQERQTEDRTQRGDGRERDAGRKREWSRHTGGGRGEAYETDGRSAFGDLSAQMSRKALQKSRKHQKSSQPQFMCRRTP
ncbi:hypothetical protein TGP89_419090 [Toxoplasma gondii p89]|uniref:Uncharacterized protein n=1 Tax=Toxoplasma gondii p89 TaxID=943119 RepID=A0A086KQ13_TOXGO|nr:hypothetical protein TGP89_419090 [Toxoplasma gondii p89]